MVHGHESGTMTSAPPTLHVISPVPWIAEAFRDAMGLHDAMNPHVVANSIAPMPSIHDARQWHIASHPFWERPEDIIRAIHDDDALWIAPAALTSLNVWRNRHGMPSWSLRAPSIRWLERLPQRLTGRHVLFATVGQIRGWHALPSSLGEQPWTQLCGGRVEAFNAARRDLGTLQDTISQAPENTTIQLDAHVRGITEEWAVAVHHGQVMASSGYCIHMPPDSRSIITVFDLDAMHRYDEDGHRNASDTAIAFRAFHRPEVERVALEACAYGGIGDASMLIAWRGSDDEPIVLEADPLWCSTPYPFTRTQMLDVIDAIRESRIMTRDSDKNGTSAHRTTQLPPGETSFVPDPWTAERYGGLFSM